MKHRKHRVVVEITTEEPVTQKRAKDIVERLLDCTVSDHTLYVTKWEVKEGDGKKKAASERSSTTPEGEG
jgi:glycine cleavage system protein P-like pyridoxal-binding family